MASQERQVRTERESINGYEDEDGCPTRSHRERRHGHRRAGVAKILRNGHRVEPGVCACVEHVAKTLKDNPKIEFEAAGHADSR
jgi:hypothetical protein